MRIHGKRQRRQLGHFAYRKLRNVLEATRVYRRADRNVVFRGRLAAQLICQGL
jgi:hypothetical protein